MMVNEMGDAVEQAWKFRADGKLSDAEALCRRILDQSPNHADALHLLGIICNETDRRDEGLKFLFRSVRYKPQSALIRSNLAAALGSAGRLNEAAEALKNVIRLEPTMSTAYNNLGVTLERMGRHAQAAEAYRKASELERNEPMFVVNLANVLRLLHQYVESESAFRRAIALRDDDASAWKGLALVLQQQGRLWESIRCLHEAIRLRPADADIHGVLVYSLHYSPDSTAQQLLDEAKRWARRHEARPSAATVFSNVRDARRRLRVGYLSPDFRDHVIGRLLEPVLKCHDPSAVELFAYCDVTTSDAATARMRNIAATWRDVKGVSDAALETIVRNDRIDILVETAGHFGGNRLRFMSGKSAPIQISAFGYCGTTGVGAIDYRVTDPFSDPPGQTEAYHTERLLRLPDCANCYAPADAYPNVGPLPAVAATGVTFCCFNNPVKITDQMIELWAQILREVPRSRLKLLLAGGGALMRNRFTFHGIEIERIEPVNLCPRFAYMDLYNHCDIGLDCFPFHGDNTTLDALWMGVPVITLAGDRFASRRGLSHMMNLGRPEWIAYTPEEYVEKAIDWASDLKRLGAARSGLRAAFKASPLGNVERWTRDLETAYRTIWTEYCQADGSSGDARQSLAGKSNS